MSETGALISRIYSNFRGVDFRGEEINLIRSPDSLNVWKDYKKTESIRTRPGMKRLFSSTYNTPTVDDIYSFKDEILFCSKGMLYRVVKDSIGYTTYDGLINGIGKPVSFVFGDYLYFIGNGLYYRYDGNNVEKVIGYIPTTSIGSKPNGGGRQVHEDVNMVTIWRKNSFVADGKSTEYYLDGKIDSIIEYPGNEIEITINGHPVHSNITPFEVDRENGKITFSFAPAAPSTDGQDNVVIKFPAEIQYPNTNLYRRVFYSTIAQVFDNRVFFGGHSGSPNTVWHSSLNDPTYISDLDYYHEGSDPVNVKAIVPGNNALWVFREPSDTNTNIFYHTPTTDYEYGKIYPSIHSSVSTGCVGKAINFNDDIVFFSDRGMEGISGDISTEQVVAHRSSLVDAKLLNEKGYKNMILVEWEGYLLVFVGNKVYLADSRTAFAYENHMEYEWFYWELEKNVNCAKVHDGILYIGTDDGIYTLDDMESNVESYWTTPKDKFKTPHKLKTTNKRGCVVEATGDISVYAKVEDTDFEHIGTYENVTDYFVSRIKRKKFKDIQLKFYSKTRFSLETATLECFIGGYIKR